MKRSRYFFRLLPWVIGMSSLQAAVSLSVQNVTSTSPGGGTNPFALMNLRCGSDPSVFQGRAGAFALTGNTSSGAWTNQMTFCIEVAEPLSGGGTVYQFNEIPVENAAAGSAVGGAGLDSMHSANIPMGGIGQMRAARLGWLFENYFQGTSAGDWEYGTNSSKNAYAFQLAVWEVTHDDDLTLAAPADLTGYQGFSAEAASTATKNTNSVAQADMMLAALAAANVDISYRSTKWQLVGLSNNGANQSTAGAQDVVTAVAMIPEVSSSMMLGLASVACLLRRRRK